MSSVSSRGSDACASEFLCVSVALWLKSVSPQVDFDG
jgi:hypothetical protein